MPRGGKRSLHRTPTGRLAVTGLVLVVVLGPLLPAIGLASTAAGPLRSDIESPTVDDGKGTRGVSAMEVQTALERLGSDPDRALEALVGLQTPGGAPDVPAALLGRVRDPPTFERTASTLATLHPAVDREALQHALARPLPPGVAQAASSLGQGVIGAHRLVEEGRPRAGGLLMQAALQEAQPALTRAHLILEHEDAYSGLSWDRSQTDTLARDAQIGSIDGRRMGLNRTVGSVDPGPLSAELAGLYARLGLPFDQRTRLALGVADAVRPSLADPLRHALAHLDAAIEARNAAYSELGPGATSVLREDQALRAALSAPRPTEAQLQRINAYGIAVERLDEDELREAVGHLARARSILSSLDTADQAPVLALPASHQLTPDPPDAQPEVPPDATQVGSLVLERTPSTGQAPGTRVVSGNLSLDLAAGTATVNASTGALRFSRDGRTVLETPALSDPSRDVLFRDPLGIVQVTGENETTIDSSAHGPRVRVPFPDANASRTPIGNGSAVLDRVDRHLSDEETFGGWPYVRGILAQEIEHARSLSAEVPSQVNVTLNPAGYRVLHVDLGGDDTYRANAGGAGEVGLARVESDGVGGVIAPDALATPLPASLLVELGGDDRYNTTHRHTIAAANASVALLADRAGHDRFLHRGPGPSIAAATNGGLAALLAGPGNATYRGPDRSIGYARQAGGALLLERGGNESYHGGNDSLAASRAGWGAMLVDRAGNDTYRSWNHSQAASTGGAAILVDVEGADRYDPRRPRTSQGYPTPYRALPGPCPVEGECPQVVGPARLALLVDASGEDQGACTAGELENEDIGTVGIGRDPVAGPYNPTAGTCLDAGVETPGEEDAQRELDDLARGGTDGYAVPPTFFTSSFGNATVPGLFRVGGIDSEQVTEPYLLSVDLLGSDTYRFGAVAIADAERAAKLTLDQGYIAPVSAFVDAGGDDVYDPPEARELPGYFGYARGGVALQASLWTDVERFDITRERVPWPTNTFEDVPVGLGAAEEKGVAMLVHQGIYNIYKAPPADADRLCRLACATTGGTATVIAEDGPGDRVNVTNMSLGAVAENPLGGAALYYHKGGQDTYDGYNESMGVVQQKRWTRSFKDHPIKGAEGELDRLPSVALFVKDGWGDDRYKILNPARPHRTDIRGDDRRWQNEDTYEAFHVTGNRTLRVGQGYDNLDWFLQSRMAKTDRVAAVGPPLNAGPIFDAFWDTTQDNPFAGPAPVGHPDQDPLCPGGPPFWCNVPGAQWRSLREAWVGSGPTGPGGPLGLAGIHGRTTGAHGVQPLTLAYTPMSPVIQVPSVTPGTTNEETHPRDLESFGGRNKIELLITADAPAQTDEQIDLRKETNGGNIVIEEILEDPGVDREEGASVSRVDVVIEGLEPWWDRCPYEPIRSRVSPERCLAAVWTKDAGNVIGRQLNSRIVPENKGGSSTKYTIQLDTKIEVPGQPGRQMYPPGRYQVSVRAFSEEPYPHSTGFGLSAREVRDRLSGVANYTDDQYGYYGSAYHIRAPIYNPPRLLSQEIDDATRDQALSFSGKINEPGTYNVTIFERCRKVYDNGNVDNNAKCDGREIVTGNRTAFYNNSDAFVRNRFDYVNFTWSPSEGRRPGDYIARIEFNGSLSDNPTKNVDSKRLYFDPSPPRNRLETGPLPRDGETIIARDIWRGHYNVSVSQDGTQGAPATVLELWGRRLAVDVDDPSKTVSTGRWEMLARADPEDLEKHNHRGRTFFNFSVPVPDRGSPPVQLELGVNAIDRAGQSQAPPGRPPSADIAPLFDLTRPKTTLELVDPSPIVAATRGGPVTVEVETDRTPDLDRARILATVGVPGQTPTNVSNYTEIAVVDRPGRPAMVDPATGNLTGNLTDGRVLYLMSLGRDIAGNREVKSTPDIAVEVDRSPPVVRNVTVHPRPTSATVSWSTDEPSNGTLRVLAAGSAKPVAQVRVEVPEAGAWPTRHTVEVTGLSPGRDYRLAFAVSDRIGNNATHRILESTPARFTTPESVEIDIQTPARPVSEPFRVNWTGRPQSQGVFVYNASLSLDDGATFPVELGRTRVFEDGNGTHSIEVDPSTVPESDEARIRVQGRPAERPEAVASAVSDIFTIDAHGPTPGARGAGLEGYVDHPVDVEPTAMDNGSGVARVEVSRDNVTFEPVNGSVRVEGPDPTTLYVRARDRAGNLGPARPVHVLVDLGAPNLTAELGTSGQTPRTTVAVRVHAEDAASGLASVRAADGHGYKRLVPSLAFVQGNTSLSWNLTGPEGVRQLELTAYDRAGNTAKTTLELTVDRTPPRGTIEARDPGYTTARLELSADEPVSVDARLDGPGRVRSPDGHATTQTVDLTELLPGRNYTATVTAEDRAGIRRSFTTSFATTPDHMPPNATPVAWTDPNPDGTVSVVWRPADDNVRIDRYRVDRSRPGASGPVHLGSTEGTRFVDTTAQPGRTYSYHVTPIDVGQNTGPTKTVEGESRTQPRVLELNVSARDGALDVSATVVDPDGDRPIGRFVLANDTYKLDTEATTGARHRLTARIDASPTSLGDSARGYHLTVEDGRFTTRFPLDGQRRAPAVPASGSGPWTLVGGALTSSLAAGLALTYLRRRGAP